MPRTVDVVAGLTAVVLAGGLGMYQYERASANRRVETAASEVRRFQRLISLRAAAREGTVNARGFPVTVDPAWFAGDPPRNPLLSPDRPWVELAPAEHAHLLHPEVRIAVDRTMAAFWYNPYQGVVRARVPTQISDRAALDLYNRLNDTELDSIFYVGPTGPAAALTDSSAEPAPEPDDGELEPDELDPTRPASTDGTPKD